MANKEQSKMSTRLKKYSILIIVAVLLVAIAFAGTVGADYTLQGKGTEADPYLIGTALDLYNMTQNASLYHFTDADSHYFQLTEDIYISNISSIVTDHIANTITINSNSAFPSMKYNWSDKSFNQSGWNPGFNESVISLGLSSWPTIGNSSSAYHVTGNINFDGMNKKIYGLFINDSLAEKGLFGYIGPNAVVNITNLTLENAFVSSCSNYASCLVARGDNAIVNVSECNLTNCAVIGCSDVGGLVGCISGTYSSATIIHCAAKDCCVPSNSFMGILAGSAYRATIIDCDIERCNLAGDCVVGGLVGNIATSLNASGNKMITCNVTGNDDLSLLIGGASCYATINTSNCVLTNCVANGKGFVGGLIGCANSVTVNAIGCNLANCAVAGCDNVGGLVGYAYSAIVNISDCNLDICSIAGNNNVGGQLGEAAGAIVNISDCNLDICSITALNYGSGGMVGNAAGAVVNTSDCNLTDCIVTGRGDVGGLVGFTGLGAVTCIYCTVADCRITAENYYVGGLVGYSNSTTIVHCDVIDCENISGSYWVGGLIGCVHPSNPVIVNHSKVTNSKIIGTYLSSSYNTIGGVIGSSISSDSEINNNTLTNVLVNVTGGNAMYAYLFDVTQYPIHNMYGIAKLAQITLSNNNKIINSYVLNISGNENARFDGFKDLTTEFAIIVSNPLITSIEEDNFKDTNVTSITNLSSAITIGENAFYGSKLTGGFYIPVTATIDMGAFNGTDYLQIIYGNTTAGLTGLNEWTAVVNITDVGNLDSIQAGSFSLSPNNKFETVILGSDTANKFKNLSDGTYLTVNGPWTPGYIYLAESEYIPQYTPSSSKHSGSTVILQEGQTAPNQVPPTIASTAAPTAKPTEKPVTPVVNPTAKPTTQPTQSSPAPVFGLIAGLGAIALVLTRQRR